MELLVEAFNVNHAYECIKNKIPNIILSNEIFATRINHSFSESEITTINNEKQTSKIWVKVNVFFFEHQINRLVAYLKWLSRIKIDYVIFQDFAVAQINDEYNLGLKLHYNPECLITSYHQFDFYQACQFNGVFIAREIMMNELEEISKNKKNLKIEIQGHGYGFIMYSRWKLISNFSDYYQTKINNHENYLLIKEKLRKYPNVIFEDRHGTNMMTGYLIYCIDMIDKLKKMGIDYLKLDFVNTNEQYAIETSKLYQQTIEEKISEKQAYAQLKKISNQFFLSHGFLGGLKEILHLQKEEENNE